jgi:3-phenylpropionate/trans-cinnamate dioxygenase ferredoxin reductase component
VADARTFVVLGASLAGGTAAATLRGDGFDGRLVMIGGEARPPYERPPLSKTYLRGEDEPGDLLVRPADWWGAHGVETRLGARIEALDPVARTVTLAGGETIGFDAALVATGVRNRTIGVPGADLDGVFHLRSVADADRIRAAAARGGRALVVGMGFIGAEVAASLRTIGLEVTAVDPSPTPLYRVLGPDLGRVLEGVHRDHGVEVVAEDVVERFEGGARVERAVTRAGRTLDCDFAVVGIGTQPNDELMRGAGVSPHGGVAVDAALQSAFPGVFAAGDIAAHEHPIFGRVRIEHYDNALKMGEHVAHNMLGAAAAFDDPHWFWSDQYEHELQVAGFAPAWATMIVRGSIEDRRFCAFLLDREGVLRSTFGFDWPRDVRRSMPVIRAQVAPDPAALADPQVDLRTLVSGVSGKAAGQKRRHELGDERGKE